MRYWDAREQLAEAKGQESPEYCTEFEAGQ